MTMVLPRSLLSSCRIERISSAVVRSRSPVGSSHSNRFGSDTMARAIDALLLAARHFPRPVFQAIGETDDAQRGADARRALLRLEFRQQQRKLDILRGRQHRHQIV